MHIKSYRYHITLILFIYPSLINGFFFWPFQSNNQKNDESWSSLFGRMFPSIKWNRAPVLGINAYKEVNMGDAGEFRNDFVFRLGPEPKVISHGMDQTVQENQYIFESTNDLDRNRHFTKRQGRLEYMSFGDASDDLDSKDLRDEEETMNQHYVERPEKRQVSPR